MIWNGLIAGGPKNLDVGIVTKSIVDDCLRWPTKDWDKYLPIIVEIGKILLKDRESEREHEREMAEKELQMMLLELEHEREMAEKLLQMMLLNLKSEERKKFINKLIECIDKATTEQDKLAYLYLYYLVTKEPILER